MYVHICENFQIIFNYRNLCLIKQSIYCSSVGISTRYGLQGAGIESQWKRDFPHPSRPSLVSTQLPVQCVQGLTRGKAAEAWP